MSETLAGIDARVRKMMSAKTPAERLRMASGMLATARRLIRAGAPAEHRDSPAYAFMRLYGADFSPAERDRILTHLSRASSARSP